MMITLLVLAALCYISGIIIYRLYLSPLAEYPGNKLAASTLWYEFYYQAVKGGQYPWKIQEMHKKYGPIIRINPYELHVNDPNFYDELYNFKPFNKYRWHTQQFGHPNSSANTVEHELHRSRTAAIAPYFARGMILQLERAIIQDTLQKLCGRIEGFRSSGGPMPLGTAYRAFTTDVITKYTMSTSFGFLEKEDFNDTWFREFLENVRLVHIISHFPWYPRYAKKLPRWLRSFLIPRASQLVDFHHVVEQEVTKTKTTAPSSTSLPTVFHAMSHNPKLPPSETSIARLTDEGVLFVVAGNETTGNTLSVTTYHLLSNPDILATLKTELEAAIPDASIIPLWQDLSQLPYLSAVIKEGLRLSYGVVSRMPRLSPTAPLLYKQWIIPPNTPVSMNTMDMHDDPTVFPNPAAFMPDRWLLPSSAKIEDMEKHLVPFCRGTRACVGRELAYAEIYITIATLFRRYDFELYETERSDVQVAHEYHIPQTRRDTRGVRVLVK